MPQEKKTRIVAQLAEELSRTTSIISTGYQGLSVPQITVLRRLLSSARVDYRVVKNTLLKRSVEQVGRQELLALVEGPTAIAFGYEDPLVPLRVLEEYVRTARTSLELRGALIEGQVFYQQEALALARLPSREQLLSQALGTLQAPLARLLGTLRATLWQLLGVLSARLEQLESPQAEEPTAAM